MSTLLAVPSCLPGGLDAPMGMHFGHCEIYTLVEVEDGAVLGVSTLESVPHEQGGCGAAVHHLAAHGVGVLAAGGMGMRPLMLCGQLGVTVVRAADCATVGEAVDRYLKGLLPAFSSDDACRAHGH